MLTPQRITQLGQQGIIDSLRKVATAQGKGICLATGATTDHQRLLAVPGFQDHGDFCSRLIRAVDHDIGIRRHDGLHVLGGHEVIHDLNDALGIDIRHPPAHGFDLGLTQRTVERVYLPIDIGLRHMVQVHKREPPHPTACQRFNTPGADAADTGHGNVAATQPREAVRSVQAIQPTEAAFGVDKGLLGHREGILAALQCRDFKIAVLPFPPKVDTQPITPTTPSASSFRLLTEAERRASLEATLAGLPQGADIWVFGYGSLIWRPEFDYTERRDALLHGYHRSLCLWSRVNRGTPDKPGLVFGLDAGGSCRGVAYRIDTARSPETMEALWRREMPSGAYIPKWLNCRTEQGTIRALAFTMNRNTDAYVRDLPEEQLLHIVRNAHGSYGPCIDYVLETADALLRHDINDKRLFALAHSLRQS